MTQETKTRVLWAVIFAALVAITIFGLGEAPTFLAATAAGMWGWREYSRMMGLRDKPAYYYVGYILIVLSFTHAFTNGVHTLFWFWVQWVMAFLLIFAESYAAKMKKSEVGFDPSANWATQCRFVLGQQYIFMIFGFMGPLVSRSGNQGGKILIYAMALVFCGDAGAYFVGRRRGRRKIWPELSPSKTVEGAIGGWITSLVTSLAIWTLYRYVAPGVLSLTVAIFLGLVAPPLAQAGDFFESLLKRASGMKDSGTLMPGHGGLLDRTDGLVFVMPLVYFLF